MLDPWEGVDEHGHVRTGVSAERIPPVFHPVLAAAVAALTDALGAALHSIRLYGSVATGHAISGRSDLDLVVVLGEPRAVDLGVVVAPLGGDVVRDVGVGAVTMAELTAPTEAARVERCFLHHCTALVHGPDLPLADVPCAADEALARGFSGGILRRLPALTAGDLGPVDGRASVGRALLMAIALRLSVQEGGWSTDRQRAVDLLARHAPDVAVDAQAVFDWVDSRGQTFDDPSPPDHDKWLIGLATYLREIWPA